MFEAYKIAVTMSLTDQVTSGLLSMMRGFAKTDEAAKALEKRIQSIHTLSKAGSAAMATGFGMVALFKTPLEEAKKFQQETMKFAALGLGDQVTNNAVRFAKSMDVIGQSATDNMQLLREATAIMGDFEHAKAAAPVLAKMKVGIENVMGDGHGANFDQMFQAAIKTTELRGALVDRTTGQIDVAKFSHTLDMMTKAYVASTGLVKPQDYLAAMKTGGVSTKLMDDEMFFYGLGHFMQESGGSRTGTASMSMFQNWGMGRMSQQVAENMAKSHLLDPHAIHYGKTGHITKVDPMGIKDAKEFVQNPFKWVNEVVVPELKKEGLQGDALNIKLASLLGIRTAANLADQFVREQKLADNYIERAKRVAGVEGLYGMGQDGATMQEMELQKQYNNLMNELGAAILPLAVDMLKNLNPMVKEWVQWMRDNKGTVKALALDFVALGVALMGFGAIAKIAAGFRAIGLALDMVSFGRLGFIAKDISSVGGALGGISAVEGIGGLGATLGTVAGGLGLLVGATTAMGYALNKIDDGTDAMNHPGKRRFRHGSTVEWITDPTLPQEHAGMHFMRSGRGGAWIPDAPAAPTPPAPAEPDHKGYHYVGRYPHGQWIKDGEKAPAESQSTRTNQDKTAVINIHMDSKQIASYMVPMGTGTTDYNPLAIPMSPGMGNLGFGQ